MHPVLIDLGWFPIHTFGVLMGTGFLVGILYSLRQARKWGLDPDPIFNLSFWIMLSGVGGARLMYIAIDIAQKGSTSEFLASPISLHPFRVHVPGFLAIWEGGLVWYGGMIGATIVVLVYAWRFKMPIWRVCDLLTPGMFMGLAIGRIGCLMAGDDFGRVTTVPWAIRFTNPGALIYPDSLRGQPLHPTQIYMELKSFSIALLCHFVLTKWKRFDGMVFVTGFMIYPLARSFVEIYRGDFKRGTIPGTPLTTSQGVGLVVLVFALALGFVLARIAPKPIATPEVPEPAPPV